MGVSTQHSHVASQASCGFTALASTKRPAYMAARFLHHKEYALREFAACLTVWHLQSDAPEVEAHNLVA